MLSQDRVKNDQFPLIKLRILVILTLWKKDNFFFTKARDTCYYIIVFYGIARDLFIYYYYIYKFQLK